MWPSLRNNEFTYHGLTYHLTSRHGFQSYCTHFKSFKPTEHTDNTGMFQMDILSSSTAKTNILQDMQNYSLASQPYLFPVGGARGREKYVWTPWPASRGIRTNA